MPADPRDERLRTGLASAALFLLTAGFLVIRTGRDALYFQDNGLYGLPKAYIATAALAIPQAALVLTLLRRFGGCTTRLFVLGAAIIGVGAFYLLAEPGAGVMMTVFFVMVPLVFSIAFSTVWLMAGELLDDIPKARAPIAFSRIGASSIVGGAVGAAIARAAGPPLGPRTLLLIGVAIVIVATVTVIMAHRLLDDDMPMSAPNSAATSAPTSVRSSPNLPLLIAIAMTASLAAIFVDFQFYLTAMTTAGDSAGNTVFFANVYLVLNAASLVLQLFVAPRLQRWIGVGGSLLVLPLSLLGGAVAAIGTGSGLARAGLRITEGGFKAGIHRSVWEQAFLFFPRDVRANAKVIVDGLFVRIAEGLAGVALLVWLTFFVAGQDLAQASTAWVAIALLGSTALWVGLTVVLRRRVATVSDEPSESWMVPPPDA